jgi:8-oxo-dGTP pyrophosphatase MutT (NUDIX family)
MSVRGIQSVEISDTFDPRSVPIRRAATVMLVRDAADGSGIEAFMLRRTMGAVFGAGFYVFPGGRLDDADGTSDLDAICDGLDDQQASGLIGLPSGGLSYWIAAVRECFEEAGVLLANTADGPLQFDDTETVARFEGYRSQVHDGTLSLVELCAREGLQLAAGSIKYLSHWITPLGEPRRFDTRILMARAPQGQEPLHDDGETIASEWISPSDALTRFKRGEMQMMPPTVASLKFVGAHTTADEALAAASKIGTPVTMLPKLRVSPNGEVAAMLLPGDPGYEDMPDIEYVGP